MRNYWQETAQRVLMRSLVSEGVYELSELLRGQAGTEFAMREPVAAGASFVVLGGAIASVGLALDEVRLPLNWRFGPSARDIGDATYATRAHTFIGAGLRPLAPVHVKAVRASGDIALSWTRRTRIGGDSWESVEVPLAEDAERYEIDVLDGVDVVRTIAATMPSAAYTAAQQIADFGAPQASVALRLYQVGSVYGRGSAAAATA